MPLIQLHDVGKDQSELIASLSRQTFLETFGPVNTQENMKLFLDEQFTMSQLMAEVGLPGTRHVLAYCDGIPAGYMFIKYRAHSSLDTESALEISRIYCLQEFQGLGIGKTLMLEAINDAKKKKLSIVWLGVWKENAKALKFYQSFGFSSFGTTDFLLGKDWQEDWLMKKNI
jgi:ribosomal protein S18 acetylase RimI-like enzyme